MNMDPGTWSARVAAAIRAEMASQQRTGEALADILGVAEPTVATRLNGETPFDLVEIERVAAWLGVAPSELLARADVRAA
jgi:transcriptional regulator with XRE-family HTH domain